MANVDDQPRNQLGEWTEKPCSTQPEAAEHNSWIYPEQDPKTAEDVISFCIDAKIPDEAIDRMREDYEADRTQWAENSMSRFKDSFERWYCSKHPRPVEPDKKTGILGKTGEYLLWEQKDEAWLSEFEPVQKANVAKKAKEIAARPKFIRGAFSLNVARCVIASTWAAKLSDSERAKVMEHDVAVDTGNGETSTVSEVLSLYYPEGSGKAYDSLTGGRDSAQINELRKQVADLREQLIENTRNSAYTNELLEKLVNNSAITARQLAALNKTNANALDIARATQQTIDMDSYAAAKARAKRR